MGARFSAPVQTGPGTYPASCTMGTGSFPGVKRPGRGVDHPPSPKRRGHERVGLYFYSPSGPSWPVTGRTLLFKVTTERNCKGRVMLLYHVLTAKVTVRLCPDRLATFLFISCAGICRTLFRLFFFCPLSESYRDCNFFLSLRKIYISFFSDVMDYL